MAMAQLGPDVGGSQVLASLASQVRLQEAARIGGGPLVTPLDVYQAYRDQNERSSFRFVSFPAANFLDKVGEPTDADIQALYDKYKDVLPDPAKDTPGFKVPRKVKLEVLTADGPALAKQIQSKLTEADLKAYYDAHKDDFAIVGTLPTDLFKDDPKAALTPPRYTPFAAVKDSLAGSLAKERAQEQITETFDKISRKVDDAADAYHRAVDENDELKKEGSTRLVTVPVPPPLDGLAKESGLGHEVTPLLSSEQAKHYGQVAGASQGSNPNARGDGKFADVVFAAKSPLYEALEFVDPDGRRFLARKLEDAPAHVAPLDEVRPEVVAAWRLDKARALAEAAARKLAETVKKDGAKFKADIVEGRPVRAIEAVSRLRSGLPIPGPGLQFGPPTPAELPQIPDAGDALRSAIFDLKPGDVTVQPDVPEGELLRRHARSSRARDLLRPLRPARPLDALLQRGRPRRQPGRAEGPPRGAPDQGRPQGRLGAARREEPRGRRVEPGGMTADPAAGQSLRKRSISFCHRPRGTRYFRSTGSSAIPGAGDPSACRGRSQVLTHR